MVTVKSVKIFLKREKAGFFPLYFPSSPPPTPSLSLFRTHTSPQNTTHPSQTHTKLWETNTIKISDTGMTTAKCVLFTPHN